MKEYIVPLNDTAEDWDEMFIAVIRKQEELIRCADCKWNKSSGDWCDCPMSGMFGRKASDNYCSLAERREE